MQDYLRALGYCLVCPGLRHGGVVHRILADSKITVVIQDSPGIAICAAVRSQHSRGVELSVVKSDKELIERQVIAASQGSPNAAISFHRRFPDAVARVHPVERNGAIFIVARAVGK